MKRLLLLFLSIIVPLAVSAQRYNISGKVLVQGTDKPIGQAVVELPRNGLWSVADGEGNLSVRMFPRVRSSLQSPAWVALLPSPRSRLEAASIRCDFMPRRII